MEQFIPEGSSVQVIRELIREASPGEVFCCREAALFEITKVALIAEKAADITIQLLDEGNYVIRQVSSKRRIDQKKSEHLNDRQLAVVRALEKVLQHCRKEGVQLIGFSDELVAQPAHLDPAEGISPFALDLDTSDVYRGADSLKKGV
ncbi:response regulator [Nitrincola schmidtii]|uniref:response regulator n=1 Tax=Nitrincola schmidtii TaxID=1730894 RepID=UPI00145701F9|nr:response regulator [Nitrincola schmidtii]